MADVKPEELKGESSEEIQALMRAGVHVGHSKSKTHPLMRPFIFGTRNNIEIIDVLKTSEYLEKAKVFLKSVAAQGGTVLLVGTKPSARAAVEEAAKTINMPWITTRWVGGLLTNFKIIAKQIAAMEDIERRRASGDIDKYTKYEQAQISFEYERLLKVYNGLRVMKRLPDAVIVIDMVHDHLAVQEARKLRIPVVGLADTNTDPSKATYAVPSNDDARLAVVHMTAEFQKALEEGITEAQRQEALTKAAEEPKESV